MQIWACDPDYLADYTDALSKSPPEELQAALSLLAAQDSNDLLSVQGAEATITIEGTLTKAPPSPLARLLGFGGTSYVDIVDAIERATAMDDIETVRLKMNTPGGEVTGVDDVWQAVRALSQRKKVIAENHGLMASAGYWIASAANEIVATSPVVETGSIGVVILAVDMSGLDEKAGIKRYKIVSSNAPHKAPEPASDDGLGTLRARADAIERVFISRIAEGRGIEEEIVKNQFGRGGLLIASDPDKQKPDSLRTGMIDRIEQRNLAFDAEQQKIKEHIMRLTELIGADSNLAAEIEQLKKEAYEAGAKESRSALDNLQGRIAAVVPFLKSNAYPSTLKEVALNCLAGTEDVAVLRGAVITWDAFKETLATSAAIEETKLAGHTPAVLLQSDCQDGIVRNESDYAAMIAEMKQVQGV